MRPQALSKKAGSQEEIAFACISEIQAVLVVLMVFAATALARGVAAARKGESSMLPRATSHAIRVESE